MASECAERATSDMLIRPDWSINIELCDIINATPGQAKDALRVLKKQLGSMSAQTQLLTLDVLDTLTKNCGNKIFHEISDADVLQDLVNLINKKPDLRVQEKVLVLIDTWQEALGGRVGQYPRYYAAYQQLVNAGVRFPPREKNNASLFTSPQIQAVVNPVRHESPVQTSLQTETSPLSVSEFKNVNELADILKEMLGALGPRNREGAREEVILDLVDQCRAYQQRVMLLLTSTSDEGLLFQGLTLNDALIHALQQHENLVNGIALVVTKTAPIPHADKIQTDDNLEDDIGELAQRSKARRALRKTGSMPVSPLLPPPPSSKNPITPMVKDANFVDFLSGDLFTSETPGSSSTKETLTELPTMSSTYTNPALQFSKETSPNPLNIQDDLFFPREVNENKAPSTTKGFLSPPPSSQAEAEFDFFDKLASKPHNNGSTGSLSSSIEAPMQSLNLNLDTSTPTKEKSEDDVFRDLLDFARAKSSTPSSSRSNKRLF